MKLVFPDVTGSLCAKMDRGLSGQDAVNGMVMVFNTSPSSESANIVLGGGIKYLDGKRLQKCV